MKKILNFMMIICLLIILPVSYAQQDQVQESEFEAGSYSPGDNLYQLGKIWERIRLTFTFNEEKKADLLLEFTKRRYVELKTLNPESEKQIEKLANEILRNINKLNQLDKNSERKELMQKEISFILQNHGKYFDSQTNAFLSQKGKDSYNPQESVLIPMVFAGEQSGEVQYERILRNRYERKEQALIRVYNGCTIGQHVEFFDRNPYDKNAVLKKICGNNYRIQNKIIEEGLFSEWDYRSVLQVNLQEPMRPEIQRIYDTCDARELFIGNWGGVVQANSIIFWVQDADPNFLPHRGIISGQIATSNPSCNPQSITLD